MKNYHHLTYEDRCQIYALKQSGLSARAIGKHLGFHHSNISCEIARNSGKRGYRFKQAQEKSKSRRTAQHKRLTGELTARVESKLALQWSPQQISGWLKRHGEPTISHERIYQHIWQDKKAGGTLYKQLRHGGKKYNKRGKATAGRGCIPNRIDIDQRPDIVEQKERVGDWELDTIIGANHQGAIVSMVDRASKLTRLVKRKTKHAAGVTDALIDALGPLKEWVHTLTADNGKEFAKHQEVAGDLQADFYFAKPYHSWQRGLNEHTNGLVRQYCPKSMNLLTLTNETLQNIENLLNNRPRAVLNFQTPNEAFLAKTGTSPPVALQT
jgi:IS30 family transposase